MKLSFSHYHKFSKTSNPISKPLLSRFNFWKEIPILDPNHEFQNVSSLREPPMLIIGMEGFYFDTQESELELVGWTKPTKTHQKNKNLSCIMDSMHLSFIAASYNHHFMFYNVDRNNVT
jgi:hypothetical protein